MSRNILKYLLVLLITPETVFAKYKTSDEFTDKIDSIVNQFTTPTLKVKSLYQTLGSKNNIVILDARETEEFETSHLKNSIHIGYEDFSMSDTLSKLNKIKPSTDSSKTTVVVYCSVGYRSGKISEKLSRSLPKESYEVLNLYGGIFEWYNSGYEIVDSKSKPTQKIHTYNKSWSKWVIKGEKTN